MQYHLDGSIPPRMPGSGLKNSNSNFFMNTDCALARTAGAVMVACIAATLMRSGPDPVVAGPSVLPASAILFSDDFDDGVVDAAKWRSGGNAVVESGGRMQVLVNATDNTGFLDSVPFPVGSRGLITITRKLKMRYGNSYAMPQFSIKLTGLPVFSVHYAHMSWQSGEAMARYGFFLARNGAWPHMVAGQADTSAAIPALWDTWFEETLTYDPASGELGYYADGVLKMTFNVGVMPEASAATMTLNATAWGWFTGHEQVFDDLVISQVAVAGYAFWLAQHFTADELVDSLVGGITADPDFDGLGNLLEYALGLSPKAANTAGLPTVNATASEWSYTYTRPGERADLSYAVEVSSDLATWSDGGVTHELVSSDAVAGTQTWRARYPLASATNVFFRLKITL